MRTGIAGTPAVRSRSGRPLAWRVLPGGDVAIDLPRGEEALIHLAGEEPDLTVAPVPVSAPAPPWGLPA